MKTYFLTLCCLWLAAACVAQNITRMEYWADTDPGIGLATNISGITAQPDISSFNFNVAAQQPGFHTVGIRAKDAAGKWSHTNFFSVLTYPVPTINNISKIRYWIDSDPGFSGGTTINGVPTQSDVSNFSFVLPALSEGFHTIGIRSQDAAGKWSHTNFVSIYTYPAPANANITAIRYWIDTDPGFSAGTIISGVPAQTDVSNQSFVIPSLSNGFHTIGIRSKDASGKWSHTNFHSVYVSDQTVYNINQIEYYWGNTDPGFGNAADTTFSVAITDLNNGTLTLQNPPSAGTYNLFIRTRDVQGRWSHTNYVQNIIITSCSNFTISLTNGNISICQGQSVDVSASNGNSYTWSPSTGLNSTTGATVSVSPTVSTTYSVTGVNGACSNTQTLAVTVNQNPTVSATASNNSICNGASTTLTASGAVNYSWSNALGGNAIVTASPSATTTYTVTGTNAANCSASATVSVTVNQNPTVVITASNDSVCAGGSISLTANGALNYVWNNGLGNNAGVSASPSITTTYAVTGTDANFCTGSATQVITVVALPNTPSITISGGNNLTCTVTGAAYQWFLNGVEISGATNQTYTATESGTYTVVVFNDFGCESSASETATVIVGVETIHTSVQVLVYPNPTSGNVMLQVSEVHPDDSMIIRDMLGREVLHSALLQHQMLNISHLPVGTYMLHIIFKDGETFFSKLIKE